MKEEKENNLPLVLIVDDNANNLQVLGGFLQNEGLLVEFALDGRSALKWLEKKSFDLILLDIMMPGMDGFEVCYIIRNNPAISNIPIIFLTAKTDTESIIKGFENGAVDYITKPFIQSELLIRVKTQLNIKKTDGQLKNYLYQIEEQNRKISNSIDYARYIQNAVLSTSEENLKLLPEHFILYLPKDILSGDFYWVCKSEKRLIIAVMDCTGHGVPGALMSILSISLLNEIVITQHIIQPDKILDSLRSKIINALSSNKGYGSIKDGLDGAVISFDTGSKKLQYSGSFNPLIRIHNEEMLITKADRIPIAYYEKNENFTLHEIDIEKNDIIYLFSDGIIDQFGGPDNKRFMIKQLKEILLLNQRKTMTLQKEFLTEEFNQWKSDAIQTDDILVLGIRF